MNIRVLPSVVTTIALFSAIALGGCHKNNPADLVTSAKSYIAKSDYQAGMIQLKSALQSAPDNAEARFLLAKTLMDSGDPVAAETEIRKAMALHYPAADTDPVLARALLAQGQFNKVLTELADHNGGSPEQRADLATSLAMAHLAVGDVKSAHAAMDAALAAKPNDIRALTVRARMDVLANEIPLATQHVDAALAAGPNDADALMLKAQLEASQGSNADALKSLQHAVTANPKSIAARSALVSMLVGMKELDQAAAQVEELKKVAPNAFGTLYLDALVSFSRGDAVRARDLTQKLLGARPDSLPVLYLSGLANLKLGDNPVAEEALRKVVARIPDSPKVKRALALTYLRTGRSAQAIELLSPALQQEPNDPGLSRSLGDAYSAAGNPVKAAQYYTQANSIDKGTVIDKMRLAQAHFQSGQAGQAIQELETISQEDAGQTEADIALIGTHLRRKEFSQALAAVAVLEKKQPNNPVTYNIKGAVYVAMHDEPNARASFEKALSVRPNDFSAVHNLAVLDFQENKPDIARQRYEKLLVAEPKNEQALLALAEILAVTRQPADQVKSTIEKAIAANPKSVTARLTLVNYYLRQSDVAGARTAAQTAITAFPDDPKVIEALATTQAASGDTKQSVETLKRLVALQPQNEQALLRLAQAEVQARDYNTALDTINKAVKLQPDQPDALIMLAKVYVSSGHPEDAIREARKLQAEQPKQPLGFAIEGEVLANQSKWTEAAAAYKEALSRKPIPILAVREYVALEKSGKSGEANAMAEKWIKDHPHDAILHTYIAGEDEQNKNYQAAVHHYRAAAEIDPENPTLLNNLAWNLIQVGDPRASEYAEQASRLAPYNPEFMDTLGWALLQNGDTKKAAELLQTASRLAPANNEIHMHLARTLIKAGDKVGAKRELETIAKQDQAGTMRTDVETLLRGL